MLSSFSLVLRSRPLRPRRGGASRSAGLLLVLLGALVPPASAKVFLTQEEALALAFPPPVQVERRTAFLAEVDLATVKEKAGTAAASGLVTYYVATKEGRETGRAYFDVHLVRTLPETVMVVVDPAGAVVRVEVLSFSEPVDYLPRESWYAQFPGRTLGADLAPGRAIRPVTGATLTARATTDAARRVLALDEAVRATEAKKAARRAAATSATKPAPGAAGR